MGTRANKTLDNDANCWGVALCIKVFLAPKLLDVAVGHLPGSYCGENKAMFMQKSLTDLNEVWVTDSKLATNS